MELCLVATESKHKVHQNSQRRESAAEKKSLKQNAYDLNIEAENRIFAHFQPFYTHTQALA